MVISSTDDCWHFSDGTRWTREQQQEHVENILYGTFSLDATGDVAFAEELIEIHPDLRYFTSSGLPDIRVIVFEGTPVLAMLRVPTVQSHGKANLHAGGFALGIDIGTGVTGQGWYQGACSDCHPETGVPLVGKQVPFWDVIIAISKLLHDFFPLGYTGVDFAIDAVRGPLILELNARPGLEIQNVTAQGLRPLLERGTR